MRINRIALNGFRNYDFETADFSPGTNVIYGENAQGKTNLLESVYMLAMGRSFRTRFDRELIGFGCDSAEILADVVSHEREQTVRILLRSGVRKQITVNSVKKTASELGETLNVVLFCPDDLNLIKEGAAARRRLMDNAISQIRPRYAEYLSQFNKFYESKTRILKDWREKPSLLDTLDEFSDGMCRSSAQLTVPRSPRALPMRPRPYTASFPAQTRSSALNTQPCPRSRTRPHRQRRFSTTCATTWRRIAAPSLTAVSAFPARIRTT